MSPGANKFNKSKTTWIPLWMNLDRSWQNTSFTMMSVIEAQKEKDILVKKHDEQDRLLYVPIKESLKSFLLYRAIFEEANRNNSSSNGVLIRDVIDIIWNSKLNTFVLNTRIICKYICTGRSIRKRYSACKNNLKSIFFISG